MKSIYLLCEYGIAYSTVKNLFDKNITIYDIAFDEECLDSVWGKNSKRKLDIITTTKKVLEDIREDSLYSLIDFGVKPNIVDILIKKRISMIDIMLENEVSAKEKYNINEENFKNLNNAIIRYYIYKRNNDTSKKRYPKYVYNYIIETYGKEKFTLENLTLKLEQQKYNVDLLNEDLRYLIDNNKLKYENNYFYIPLEKLLDQINLLKEEHKNILLKKLEGRTLESIGSEYGVTRERIRQIVAKSLSKFKELEEDKYKEIFEEYNFDCDIFCDLFLVEKYVYYYLKEKYKNGEKEISELLETDIINEKQKELIRKKYNVIIFNNESLIATKQNILEAILKKYNEQIAIEDIIKLYNEFIDNYNLQEKISYIQLSDTRNIEGSLTRIKNIVSSLNRKYRYYNIEELDVENINQLFNMLLVEPGSYSTEFFYNNNLLLMRELNIKDEYELHNILRKLFSDNNELNFTRMPDILIKCDDKFNFIEDKIKELSPINIDDFCNYIYENYGHKFNTFKALILSNFEKYIDYNILKTDCPNFTKEQLIEIKKYLTKDIYSINTIKKLLTDLFDIDDFSLINNNNMLNLGYRLKGNYIIKKDINSIESYFIKKIFSENYFELDLEYKKMGTSTFTSYIYRLINDKKIFKISNDKYITIKGLNELGITINDIEEIQQQIINIVPDNEYFDLSYIKNKISLEKLENKVLNNEFIENIIIIIPELKTFRISNNRLFIKSVLSPTKESFISMIIEKHKKIKISEIKKYILDKYSINVDEQTIKSSINKNKFYYHEATECVYLNKDIYENEINQWDILKYLD